jgi:hypothetical protein
MFRVKEDEICKNPDFQKTWIHKFSLNLKLWHYEKEIILTLSYFPK